MLNRLLFVLIVSLVTVNSYAGEVCKTLQDCKQLRAQVSARIRLLQGPAPQFSHIARNADASVRTMSQYEAVSYCANLGMRLPSAKELAQMSQSMGADGISKKPKNGYYFVNAQNLDGSTDNFYFTHAGFYRPQGYLGNYRFWSSSIVSSSPNNAFYLEGERGVVNNGDRYYNDVAVGCI